MAAAKSKNKVIVLTGPSGSGKSSTGNTLVGRDAFQVLQGDEMKIMSQSSFQYNNEKWTVYDMPSLYHIEQNENKYKSIKYTVNTFTNFIKQIRFTGINAFVMVFNGNVELTPEDCSCFGYYKSIFGEDFLKKYGILVFTHSEQLMDDFEPCLQSQLSPSVKKILLKYKTVYDECPQRICLVSNSDEEAVREKSEKLLKTELQNMFESNEIPYTLDMYMRNENERARCLQHLRMRSCSIL